MTITHPLRSFIRVLFACQQISSEGFMITSESLGIALTILIPALLIAAGVVMARRRRRLKPPPQGGWLTDSMVQQIIERGSLTAGQVPGEALDLEEIAREEERFWSETWDEPDHYWE